jgi:lysophospholipase L1-like esterase
MRSFRFVVPVLSVLGLTILGISPSWAQSPQQFAPDATRYMALGDSIAAGYKAMPVTNGYAFRLYQDGVFDALPHTLFVNAAVPGATSTDVLMYQVPQAVIPSQSSGFNPGFVTLTVGGDDLVAVLGFAMANQNDPNAVLAFAQQQIALFGQNLGAILAALRTGLPAAKIFVSNQYTIPEIQALLPITDTVVDSLNATIAQVVGQFSTNVYLVDVHGAFLGRNNLIEGERPNVSIVEVHPTNAGQRVIEQAFAAVIAAHK